MSSLFGVDVSRGGSAVFLAECYDLGPFDQHGGSWKAFEGAVRIEYFEKYKTQDACDGKRDAASKTRSSLAPNEGYMGGHGL